MALAAAILPLYLGYGARSPAIVVALVAGAVVGLLNGTLVAVVGMQPIVATLALLVGGRGLALVIADGQLKQIRNPDAAGRWAPATCSASRSCVLIAAVLAARCRRSLVHRTTFGRQLRRGRRQPLGGRAGRAAGQPGPASASYVICGVLAAIAGVLATARLTASDPSVARHPHGTVRHHRGRRRRHPAHRRHGPGARHGRRRPAHAAAARHLDQARPARLDRADRPGGDHRRRRLRGPGARPDDAPRPLPPPRPRPRATKPVPRRPTERTGRAARRRTRATPGRPRWSCSPSSSRASSTRRSHPRQRPRDQPARSSRSSRSA